MDDIAPSFRLRAAEGQRERAGVDAVELVGVAAGALTTAAFVPQAVKTLRTRSAGDFALPMLLMFNLGLALWLAYGVLRAAPGLILANGITLALALAILWVKLVTRR
ncbi:MAG: SemiSWEET transporter [Acetobacteraceae bacterium]|nr:SemiSWEET transporter [Acetobacteraceae bacterium]